MHALQAIAVIAVLVVGLGAKLVISPAQEAEASRGAIQSASANFLQINLDHQNADRLPVEKIHDMTFVFPEKD